MFIHVKEEKKERYNEFMANCVARGFITGFMIFFCTQFFTAEYRFEAQCLAIVSSIGVQNLITYLYNKFGK